MSTMVVVGAQWGDEGKGKVVDYLAGSADSVVRFQGGNNAGHTLVVNGEQVILHLVPSGVLRPDTRCYIGSGVVLDPAVFLEEVQVLTDTVGCSPRGRLLISDRAHVILEPHKRIEAARENAAGGSKIGTTRRGIGPAYEARAARKGIRVCDLIGGGETLRRKLEMLLGEWNHLLKSYYDQDPVREGEVLERCLEYGRALMPFVADVAGEVDDDISQGKSVLFEGAQGTLLDCDHGTYPYVTSSNTVAGAVTTGCGIGPTRIDKVLCVAKAYTTRVGEGPFPTELDSKLGDWLRERGKEYGATTGRPRRCGWLDMVALKYALRCNGATSLVITKLDVLAGLDEIKICIGYEVPGKDRIDTIPPLLERLSECRPIYETHPGFDAGALSAARSFDDLPGPARTYLHRIEELAGVPVEVVSVGPARQQTLVRGRGPWV